MQIPLGLSIFLRISYIHISCFDITPTFLSLQFLPLCLPLSLPISYTFFMPQTDLVQAVPTVCHGFKTSFQSRSSNSLSSQNQQLASQQGVGLYEPLPCQLLSNLQDIEITMRPKCISSTKNILHTIIFLILSKDRRIARASSSRPTYLI